MKTTHAQGRMKGEIRDENQMPPRPSHEPHEPLGPVGRTVPGEPALDLHLGDAVAGSAETPRPTRFMAGEQFNEEQEAFHRPRAVRRAGVRANAQPVFLLLAAALAALIATFPARAQNFALDWFTFDGDGGVSTGGVYSVSGTIGQPDAGVLAGGNYTLVGGFWSIVAVVQEPRAPLLRVSRVAGATGAGSVRLSWPNPSIGFRLQSTPSLSAPRVWSDVSQTPAVVGEENVVLEPAALGDKFYRLKKP